MNTDITNITIGLISLIVAIFSAIAAWKSWSCANQQKRTEIFKLRCEHIKNLKKYWSEFNRDIIHISGYKTYVESKDNDQDKIISNMNSAINKFKLLNVETLSLFNKEHELEKEFILSLDKSIPQQEWNIYHIKDSYEISINLFNTLIDKLEDELNKNAKI